MWVFVVFVYKAEEFKTILLKCLFFLHRLPRAETCGTWDSGQLTARTQLITGSWWAIETCHVVRMCVRVCDCVCVRPSAFQNFDMCADV